MEKSVEQKPKKSSYSAIIERMNGILGQYSGLPMDSVYSAFGRAISNYWANAPTIQNSRLKTLNPLPCDFSKEELNFFLTHPAQNELALQQIAEGLKWSNYSFFKLTKSYSDMMLFKNYVIPQNVTADDIKSDTFRREYRLIDKLIKAFNIKEYGQKVAQQALTQGKVFYVPRYEVDKSHNTCRYAFLQPLPKAWTTLIGQNSLSSWTVSFNMFYFLQPGTDYTQFGDLFLPYLDDFSAILEQEPKNKDGKKYIYASKNDTTFTYKIQNKEYIIYPNHLNREGAGKPKMFMQNGRWFYWVSLPIDRVWTFEIDDTTPIVASPFAGLMQTFAQQADYEAAQLSLILNPLIKIFTGEIPYYKSSEAKEDDGYRLSIGGRALFEALFDNLMAKTNTAGVGFYTAPVENIKSHDFSESANANQISQSFLNYGMAKTGTQGIIPVTDRPTQGVAEISAKLEARFAQCIYGTLEKMFNYIIGSLNLQYDFRVHIFGDIYSEDQVRANCLKLIDKGSTYAYLILGALDDVSLLDMISMTDLVGESGLLSKLSVPPTAFTQTTKSQPKSDTNGAPTKTEQEKQEDKTIDAGIEEE